MKLALTSLLAAGALAGCADYRAPPASAAAPPAPAAAGARLAQADCFRTTDIRNHTVGDSSTMYLDVRGRGTYRVGMSGRCLAGYTSSDPLLMRQPPGSAIACAPIDLDISVTHSGDVHGRCIVSSLVRLTPEQAAALPPRLRP